MLNNDQKTIIYNDTLSILTEFVTKDYAAQLCDSIIDDVYEDIEVCTQFEYYNDTDIKLAIGRVLWGKIT